MRRDIVVSSTGQVVVRRSTGIGFSPNEVWSQGTAHKGDRDIAFADMTGDGKADMVLVDNNDLVVRRSLGTHFGPDQVWIGHAFFGDHGT